MQVTLTAKLWNDCVAERIAAEDAGVDFDYFGKSPIARLLQEATEDREWCVGRFGIGDDDDTWEAFKHVVKGHVYRRPLSDIAAAWEAWFEMGQNCPTDPETFEVFADGDYAA